MLASFLVSVDFKAVSWEGVNFAVALASAVIFANQTLYVIQNEQV
jgi:hypothetical protein